MYNEQVVRNMKNISYISHIYIVIDIWCCICLLITGLNHNQ